MKICAFLDAGNASRVPDFVFLAHVVDVTSSMHVPFCLRSFGSLPFRTRFFLIPFWPVALIVLLAMWVWSKTFLVSFYYLRGRLHQTWVVPRCGFQVGVYNSTLKIVFILFFTWILSRIISINPWFSLLLFIFLCCFNSISCRLLLTVSISILSKLSSGLIKLVSKSSVWLLWIRFGILNFCSSLAIWFDKSKIEHNLLNSGVLSMAVEGLMPCKR